jgi:hypothetical protein
MENPTTPDPDPGTGVTGAAAVPVGEPVVGQGRWRDYSPVEHADSQEVCKHVEGLAATDTAGWLAHRGLVPGRTARAEVRLSGDLTDGYAATGSALLAGDIDAQQAEIVVWAVKRLPQAVDAAVRARAEKHLLEEARRLDAAQLRVAGRRLLEVVDPEAAEAAEAKQVQDDEDAAAAKTWFTTWDDGEGTTHISAKVPTRHADMLAKALHNIANPKHGRAAPCALRGSDRGSM